MSDTEPTPTGEETLPEIEWRKDIHTWFELSYASYLVLNRSLLQSMPEEWQHEFVELLEQLGHRFRHLDHPVYDVRVRDENGRFKRDPIPHYNRGRTFIEGCP